MLVAVNILNFYDRNVIGALAEPIRREFHLDDTQVGLLGSIFIWLYAIVGVPLGRIADGRSRKRLLAGGMAAWSVLTAMAAMAGSYSMLLISRLGFAVGEAVVAPTATSWIGDLFPSEKRAGPLALFMIGVPAGAALTYFFSGSIAQAFGWRVAMVVAAAPALLLIPLLLRLREPVRGAAEARAVQSEASTMSIMAVLRIPTFQWIIASGALVNFNHYALGTFMPALLSRVHHVTLAQSGIATGIAYMSGGVVGSLIAGWFGDRVALGTSGGRLKWGAAFALAGAPAAYFGIQAESTTATVALLAVFYLTLCSYYGFVYSSIQDIVPPSTRATAMAVYFMAMYLCGASFGPLLTGKMSDVLAHRAAALAGSPLITDAVRAIGLRQAMLAMPVLSVLLSIVLFLGSRTIGWDSGELKRRNSA